MSYSAPSASPERTLYLLSALILSSRVPHPLTFLRKTNGAESLRAYQVAAKHRDDSIALTYTSSDAGAMGREKDWKTREMVKRWRWHNNIRIGILVLGRILGRLGVGLSKRRDMYRLLVLANIKKVLGQERRPGHLVVHVD
jgi:hypothetical protein